MMHELFYNLHLNWIYLEYVQVQRTQASYMYMYKYMYKYMYVHVHVHRLFPNLESP